ncbi:MAG: thiamine phosphate synthase [Bacillota bacterium]
MKFDERFLLLNAVTDRAWLNGNTLEYQVEQAILGGATMVQLREKDLPDEEFIRLAQKVKTVTDKYRVPFVINDNVEVAVAVDADGVHVGQSDMPASLARERIGRDRILGVSVQTVEQAKKAQEDGADYIGAGCAFATSTKADASCISFALLRQICEAVTIPAVAIGGINEDNAIQLKGTKIKGIAVVSAIFSKPDIQAAAASLAAIAKTIAE